MLLSTGIIDDVMDTGWNTVFTNPIMELRDGTPPASADAAETGNLLATVTLPTSGYFGAASNGIKQGAGSWNGTVSAGGTPTWFRIKNTADGGGSSSTLPRIDGTVGASGSDADLIITTLPFVALDTLDITDFTLAQGQGVIGVDGGGTLL